MYGYRLIHECLCILCPYDAHVFSVELNSPYIIYYKFAMDANGQTIN